MQYTTYWFDVFLPQAMLTLNYCSESTGTFTNIAGVVMETLNYLERAIFILPTTKLKGKIPRKLNGTAL